MVWSLCSSRDCQESSPTPQFKSISSSVLSFFYVSTLISIHDYWKTIVLTRWTFFGKVMSLLFNMPSRFGHIFSSKNQASFHFLAAPSAVILETKKTKPVTGSIDSPSACHEVMDRMPWSYFLECWVLSHHFHSLYAIKLVSSTYLRLLIFLPAILIPPCASSSLAFYMMHFAYKLIKQGDNIQCDVLLP